MAAGIDSNTAGQTEQATGTSPVWRGHLIPVTLGRDDQAHRMTSSFLNMSCRVALSPPILPASSLVPHPSPEHPEVQFSSDSRDPSHVHLSPPAWPTSTILRSSEGRHSHLLYKILPASPSPPRISCTFPPTPAAETTVLQSPQSMLSLTPDHLLPLPQLAWASHRSLHRLLYPPKGVGPQHPSPRMSPCGSPASSPGLHAFSSRLCVLFVDLYSC